jgi:ABC-2 type transport system permease protein
MTQALRDRRTLAIVLITPLVELLLFAYAVDMTVDHIPTAVTGQGLDDEGQALLEALSGSGYFDILLFVPDQAAVVRAIDAGQVRAGIVFPPDFATAVQRGRAQALILLDGSDPFTVQSGYAAAMAVASTRSMDLLVEKANRMGAASALQALPISTSARVLYNPEMNDLIFILPALTAMVLQVLAVTLTATAVARERELGTLEQLLVTPIRPVELMIGKMTPYLLISAVSLAGITLVGVFWFQVPFQGSPWLYAWLSLLFIISGLGLGLLISTVSRTQHQAQQVSMILFLLSLLLTGFLYPRAAMPPLIQAVGSLVPLTYYIRIVRGIFTKGVGLSFLWSDVFALVVYAAVVMLLAAVTFRKRLD